MNVGKTRIDINARGCHDCGTEYATGWHVFKMIEVQIGKVIIMVRVSLCDPCHETRFGRPLDFNQPAIEPSSKADNTHQGGR